MLFFINFVARKRSVAGARPFNLLNNTMTHRLTVLLRAALAAAFVAAHLPAGAQTPLQRSNNFRVMTYNVRNAVGMDGRRDYRRVADAMVRAEADVVAVQEVDSATHRSGGRYVLGEIAREALLHDTFAAAIDYDGGRYGVGLLSRQRPLNVRRVPLPGREEARVLLVAEFDRYVVGCTHLSLTAADRMASLELLRKEAARFDKPFILAGDWNDTIGSPFMNALKQDFKLLNDGKVKTYPADKPVECIDYVALYAPTAGEVVVRGARVADGKEPAGSDHRPVVAALQLKTPADRLLYREPYLQNPSPDGITVMFQTQAVSHCWVEFGTDTLHLRRARALNAGQEVCYDIENKIRLDSLTPGATYYYRVCAQEIVNYQSYSKTFGHTVRTPFYRFTLPEADATDFTALIVNDLHESRPVINALSRLAADIPHDFVIFNGDCLPEPTDRLYAMKHIHILADAFRSAEVPAFFMRGNHEIRNAYSAGMPSLFDNPGGRTYGAFSWGDTRFVMLDCGEDKPDTHWVYYGLNDFTRFRHDQVDFLRDELAGRPFRKAARRVLLSHIPVWGNTDKYQPCPELWAPLLMKAKLDVALGAHTHEYRLHAKGELGNPCPAVVGGGPSLASATLLVLEKRGKKLTLRVLDAKGQELDRLEL